MAKGRAGLLLLLALLSARWALPGRAEPHCRRGETRTAWGGDPKCCPPCTWEPGSSEPCAATQDPDCQCPPGHSCATEPCLYCLPLPRCARGQQPARIGKVNFRFECSPCKLGTYSSGGNDWCRNWTDCESLKLKTLRPGNSSHDSECGIPRRALEPGGIPLDFPSSTVLAILTAVAVLVLVLLTFLLHFCIWSLGRDKKVSPQNRDPGLAFPWPLALPGEESHSIQFPEEEHGADEKLSVLSLKAYSEIR